MMQSLIQYIGYLVLLLVLAIPLGIYMEKVMNGRQMLLNRFFGTYHAEWLMSLHVYQVHAMTCANLVTGL